MFETALKGHEKTPRKYKRILEGAKRSEDALSPTNILRMPLRAPGAENYIFVNYKGLREPLPSKIL